MDSTIEGSKSVLCRTSSTVVHLLSIFQTCFDDEVHTWEFDGFFLPSPMAHFKTTAVFAMVRWIQNNTKALRHERPGNLSTEIPLIDVYVCIIDENNSKAQSMQ